MAFAEKLVAVRRAHNLTQDQLAEKLYVTRQAVSRWERGEVTPGIDMM
ncbi:MAG: helix-turn-helix transcriptional regulator, partial [Senegalimassilia anaerobia]|nr:helix-turn-helix transcriptional regulator [Senegalimassilia anaerobia]